MIITSQQLTTSKIYRLKDLIVITGLSRSCIYDKMNSRSPRYDPAFPRSIKLGMRAVGWRCNDVVNWIDTRKSANQMEEGRI